MKLKKKKKGLKDFFLSEDAKISKKALLVGGLGISVGFLGGVTEAGHSSDNTGGAHSSNINSTYHNSAFAHSSHSSY